LFDSDLIFDGFDSKSGFGNVFREVLRLEIIYTPAKYDVTIFDADLNIRRIDPRMFGQSLIDVFFDVTVRTLEIARSAAGVGSGAVMHGVVQTFPPTTASKVSVTLIPILVLIVLVCFRHQIISY